MIRSKYLLVPLCAALLSCSSDNSDFTSQVFDDQSAATDKYTISLQGEQAVASTPSQLVYRLYGYDPFLADVSATLIFEKIIVLSAIPTTVTLEWPTDAENLIRPPVSSENNGEFYLKLYVDLDMDGQLCSGDLTQDYTQTEFFTLKNKPDTELGFHLKVIENEECVNY